MRLAPLPLSVERHTQFELGIRRELMIGPPEEDVSQRLNGALLLAVQLLIYGLIIPRARGEVLVIGFGGEAEMLFRPFVNAFEVVIPGQAVERAVVIRTIRTPFREPPVVNDGVFGIAELVVGFRDEEGGAFGGVRAERRHAIFELTDRPLIIAGFVVDLAERNADDACIG